MLDGIDMNEAMDNLIAYYPSPDALAEIRIETNNYSAEFGNVAGGVVSAITKSGTNEFHGSALRVRAQRQLRRQHLGEQPLRAPTRPSFKQHIFGGTLGGPLVKNKLFFFADYQGTRVNQPGRRTATVAPAAWRNGDFSSLLASGTSSRSPDGAAVPRQPDSRRRFSPQAQRAPRRHDELPAARTGRGLTGNYVEHPATRRTRNHQGDLSSTPTSAPNDNVFAPRLASATTTPATSRRRSRSLLGDGQLNDAQERRRQLVARLQPDRGQRAARRLEPA